MALRIDIKGHISDLKAKIGQARSSINSFASGVKSRLGGIAAGFAAAFTVGTLVSGIKSLINELDKIGKTAKSLGVGVEAYQEMAFASRIAGISTEKFSMSLGKLGTFMVMVAQRGKLQTAILQRLNLTYEELMQLKPDQQFLKITQALDGVTSASERVGIARQIFGRSGADILNMARSYEQAVDIIRAKGAIISEEDISAAEKYKDEIEIITTRLKASVVKGGHVSYWSESLNALNRYLDRVTEKGIFDFERPVTQGLLTGFRVEFDEKIKQQYGQPITKAMVDGYKKGVEEAKADKGLRDVLDATKSAGRRDTFKVDQLRRIGALPGATMTGEGDPVVSELSKWMPLVIEAARSIDNKTPPRDDGGVWS